MAVHLRVFRLVISAGKFCSNFFFHSILCIWTSTSLLGSVIMQNTQYLLCTQPKCIDRRINTAITLWEHSKSMYRLGSIWLWPSFYVYCTHSNCSMDHSLILHTCVLFNIWLLSLRNGEKDQFEWLYFHNTNFIQLICAAASNRANEESKLRTWYFPLKCYGIFYVGHC